DHLFAHGPKGTGGSRHRGCRYVPGLSSPETDPKGPTSGTGRVQRGGAWSDSDAGVLRAAFRAQMDPAMQMPDVGFRCAADRVDAHPYSMLEDFSTDDLSGWQPLGEQPMTGWRGAHGMAHAPAGDGVRAIWHPELQAAGVLSVRAFSELTGPGSLSVLYGVQDARNHYRAELFPVAGAARIIRVLDGVEGVIAEADGVSVPAGRWITINVNWHEGRHALELSNQLLTKGEDTSWTDGGLGLRVSGTGTVSFDSVFTTP
ncbi:MAG: SUMF1/EgtB/PvdO family nonheme iron enzyme, partial [Myxococcota bacterium]|nr:SUMF1/EgtB/PvdO family nonheme iron enzyme [Myxococcota bacterium]